MKTNYHLGFFLIGFILSANLFSQMTFTGEIRPRDEFRHGYQSPLDSNSSASCFISQRTRLNFGYAGENFKTGISVQDVNVWGSTSQLTSAAATNILHEAWGQYWFHPKFSVKMGRQELNYDDERLLGNTNWLQQARHHDLLLGIFADTASKFTFHAGAAYNRDAMTNAATNYTVANSYKSMQYLWANKKFGSLAASIIAINVGWQSPYGKNASRSFQTAGPYLEYKKDAIFISGRFYYQMSGDSGSYTGTGTYKTAATYMAGFDAQYTLAKKFMVGAGYEMYTGQSQTDTTKAYKEVNHVFNPLFGTGHKFNGYMDYYYAGSAHGNVGLQDIYVKLKYKAEKFWSALDVHLFSATADVYDVKESAQMGMIMAMDKNLGTEIDITLGYNLNKAVSLQFGYSHYLITETTAAVKGIYKNNGDPDTRQTPNWAYLMMTFKPNFMK